MLDETEIKRLGKLNIDASAIYCLAHYCRNYECNKNCKLRGCELCKGVRSLGREIKKELEDRIAALPKRLAR